MTLSTNAITVTALGRQPTQVVLQSRCNTLCHTTEQPSRDGDGVRVCMCLQARLFDWHEEHKYVLVQQYMNNQLQVKDRRFYIR